MFPLIILEEKIIRFLVFFPLGGAISRPLCDLTVAESQTAVLECEVASESAEGKWFKNGKPVDFSDNVRSEVHGTVRSLVIDITRPQDIGEYTYQVANSKTSANLKVEGMFRCYYILYPSLICLCLTSGY